MKAGVRTVLLLVLAGCWTLPTAAHPLAPALFEVREGQPGLLRMTWKVPLRLPAGSRLAPRLPEGCVPMENTRAVAEESGLVTRLAVRCTQPLGPGRVFAVEGLEGSPATVLLRILPADGNVYRKILHAADPVLVLPRASGTGPFFADYLALGVRHILTGFDHLLFVLALVLLASGVRPLLLMVTAFTIGHSLTLSLAVLEVIHVRPAPVEALIALSIVVVAAQLARRHSTGDAPAGVRTALLCVVFGLLHGLGFAGALQQAGLPQDELPLSLFAFNVGIEAGQLGFILLCLAAAKWLLPLVRRWPGPARLVPAYGIGCLAAMWFFERLALAAA